MSDESAAKDGDLGVAAEDENEARGAANGDIRFAVAPITHVDVRDASGSHGFWTMSGYAAVFNEKTTLYNGRLYKLTESIDQGAFDRVLRDQPMGDPTGVVHFNLGHDLNRSVAATDVPAGQPGSLQLRADNQGLFFLAKVPADDPDGVAMAAKMRSGVLRQASFAFTIAREKIEILGGAERDADSVEPEEEHRTILEVGQLFDVCATPQGAYSATTVGLRSYAAALGQPDEGDRQTVSRKPETGKHVSPDEEGGDAAGVTTALREELQKELARKRLIRQGWPDRKAT